MTIAQNVRSHLRNKPYLLEALEKGIVNLSELSRQIQEELKTENTSAVKAALRRFAEELQRKEQLDYLISQQRSKIRFIASRVVR